MSGSDKLSNRVEAASYMLTEPEVSLIGITRPLEGGTIEQHLERAARECYQSHKLMSPEDSPRFIRGIILRGHESVLEHTSATFRVLGGSRAFTHEQVRHRLLSFSQQSQRYVSETNYRAILPPAVADNPEALAVFQELLEHTREAYAKLKELGLRNEDARFVLPNAVESGIVISGNLREWRHVFRVRCTEAAQWEIRRICWMMLKLVREHAPVVFGDFVLDEETWVARHLAETVECDEAKKLVKRELEKLAQAGEPPNRILRCLADDDVYRALFHVKLCLCRSCRETLADCGDWK
jgi:thymidylate synthase (FAD)